MLSKTERYANNVMIRLGNKSEIDLRLGGNNIWRRQCNWLIVRSSAYGQGQMKLEPTITKLRNHIN